VEISASGDDVGFTGHITGTETGLTYMQARYYDPVIGRFLSPDPVGFATGGPGYFNRYAYVMNDPVNAIDPDGKMGQLITGGKLGWRVLSSTIGASDDFLRNKQELDNLSLTRTGDPTALGGDKYHHFCANCEAAATGDSIGAAIISGLREEADQKISNKPASESENDHKANKAGREAGEQILEDGGSKDQCSKACLSYTRQEVNPEFEP